MSLLASIFGGNPSVAKEIESGTIPCFPEGMVVREGKDQGKLASCELSGGIVTPDGKSVIVANDKPSPDRTQYSPVSVFPLVDLSKASLPVPSPVSNQKLYQAGKIESMTLSQDGKYVIAATAFDRMDNASGKLDNYNQLLYWPVGDPTQVQVASALSWGGMESSLAVRNKIQEALGNPEHFKIEGMTTIPSEKGQKILFGIREQGASPDKAEGTMKIVSADLLIEDGKMYLSDYKLAYDGQINNPQRSPAPSEKLGLSSLIYDREHDRLVMGTTYEGPIEKGPSGIGSFLWTLPLRDMEQGTAPTLVRTADGQPLHLKNKIEDLELLPDGKVLALADDDRMATPTKEGKPARRPHEAVFRVLDLS